MCIARTEAQGLGNVSLCFFGAAYKNLSQPNSKMGVGEISIQLQRVLTFGDALCGALGQYVDKSQQPMAARMVRDRRQGSGQLSLGRRERRRAIVHKEMCAFNYVRCRRSNERVDIVGIGNERAIAKAARLRQIVRGSAFIVPSQPLKIKVHRVGGRRLFRASRLGGGELGVQRVCQARDDIILHVEEIGERLVEPLGPQVTAGFGIDELHVDAHAGAGALNAALEDIADVQLAPDPLHVERLAFKGERRIAATT
jgi:hypothetical protein